MPEVTSEVRQKGIWEVIEDDLGVKLTYDIEADAFMAKWDGAQSAGNTGAEAVAAVIESRVMALQAEIYALNKKIGLGG